VSLASLRQANASLLALIGAALLLRAFVPAGWMPVRSADGFAIELCSGLTAGGDPRDVRAARELLDAALAGAAQDDEHEDQPGPSGQLCLFAGLAHAAPPPAPVDSVAPAPPAELIASFAHVAAVGRGLSAPPPPATGPPLFA
jgi:hypothetical protein